MGFIFREFLFLHPLPWETRAYFLVFEFLVPNFWEPKGDKAAAVEPSPLCTGSGPSERTVLLSHLLSAAQCRFRRTILQNIVGAHCIPFPGKNSLREKVKAAGMNRLQHNPCSHKGCKEIWCLLLFLDRRAFLMQYFGGVTAASCLCSLIFSQIINTEK